MTGLAPNDILESPPAVVEALTKIVNEREKRLNHGDS